MSLVMNLVLLALLAIAVESAVMELFVFEAFSPHRTTVSYTKEPISEEWLPRTSIYVFDQEEPGTALFTYTESQEPLRGMIVPGSATHDGWESKFSFYALTEDQYCTCKVTVSESGEHICGEDAGVGEPTKGSLQDVEGAAPVSDCASLDDTCKCTYSRGGWTTNFASSGTANNHLCRWPILPEDSPLDLETLFSSIQNPTEDMILCGKTWNGILNLPNNSDHYYTLAQQWIAAVLNFLNGACWDCSGRGGVVEICHEVFQSLKDTETRLSTCEPFTEDEWNYYSHIQSLYENFNVGSIGPGHCGSIGVVDDKALGQGCCTRCQRKDATTTSSTEEVSAETNGNGHYKYHPDVAESGEVYVYSSNDDKHRMLVTREAYSVADGWCPRLSFYSPCPQWYEVHW